MSLDRRTLLLSAALAGAASACSAKSTSDAPAGVATPDDVIQLWPDGAPGGEGVSVTEAVIARDHPAGLPDRFIEHVTTPRLDVFRPASPNGAAVVVAPGGGYVRIVIDKEGYEIARFLAERGVTVFVLFYRLPADGWAPGPDAPLQDAQQAIRVVRQNAAKYGVDPARVGVMGFSAGGHVAGSLATRFAAPVYAGEGSARPDFAALVYPVATMRDWTHGGSRRQLLGEAPSEGALQTYSVEEAVPETPPPLFLIHATDDTVVPVENSLRVFEAWRAKGEAPEMHLFAEGNHGFGIRDTAGKPAERWPELLYAWLGATGVV